MREAVNEEYMKMLSEDYEYDLANVKKCWILLTNIYDFIENDEMGAECLAKLVDYRRQNQDAEERKKIENPLEDSYECSRMNIFDCIPLFNDILRSVKDTYPMKTKIDEEKTEAADVDLDKKVTLKDAKLVLKYSLGIISSFE